MHPSFLLAVLAFALVIGPLVFVHEMGHYLVGRWCGIGAEVFSIGFGREVVGWTDRRGTRWKLSALPLGGYVKFAGDMTPAGLPDADWLALPPAERARTFQAHPLWQRALVVAAGPAVNFLAAFVILVALALAYGDMRTPSVVGKVMPGSPAAQAGLATGDRITALNGRPTALFEDLVDYVVLRPGERVTVSYVRAGGPAVATLTIGTEHEVDNFGNRFDRGLLGVTSGPPIHAAVSPIAAPGVAWREGISILRVTTDTLGQLVSGRRPVSDMSGPVGMAQAAGEQITLGWAAFASMMVLVSVNLGFINLLPVPLLDGGHLFFYAIEAVRRRPVGPAAQEWAFRGGLAAVLALMLVVTASDLGKLGLWHDLFGLIG